MPPSPLIVALDLPDRRGLVELARRLAPEVGMLKLGLEAFVAHGPDLVREVVDAGAGVFLDLKLHDIPRTVAAAAAQAGKLGVKLLTVHAAGGSEMIRAARDAMPKETQIVAVTMLTSLDDDETDRLGFVGGVGASADRLGALARKSGADGLVCSAHELTRLASLGGIRVVPGVRPAGNAAHDQKRVATPKEAMGAGATYLVVGRPILEASDPVAAARAINAEAKDGMIS